MVDVKRYLTVRKMFGLLCVGAERNLWLFDQPTEPAHMNSIDFIKRIGQGLLAVAATGVTVLGLQIAMLVG
jgi:hypothetical protein